jgi:hypothetical protein
MASYSAFLGRRVEVHYRAGDIVLPATGKLVADSGRSIFLEERFSQQGHTKQFRWEIPYQCIVRIDEKPAEAEKPGAAAPTGTFKGTPKSAAKAGAEPQLVPVRNRPKEA